MSSPPQSERQKVDGFLQKLKQKLSEQIQPNTDNNKPMSISMFFTGSENNSNVSLPDFQNAFNKLNYDSSTLGTIMTYFQDTIQTTLISLDKINYEMENRNLDSEDISDIQRGILKHNQELINQFKLTKQYEPVSLYNKLKLTLINDLHQIENEFNSKDKDNTKYINYKDFCDIIDNNIILNTKEIEILFENTLSNGNGGFNYEDFLTKIQTFDIRTIDLIQREFMLKNNAYIISLRNKLNENNNEELFKNKCIDLTGNIFGNITNKDFLACVKVSIGENVNIEEIEYIYKLLTCDETEKINYKFIQDRLIRYGKGTNIYDNDKDKPKLIPQHTNEKEQNDNDNKINDNNKPSPKVTKIVKDTPFKPSTPYKWEEYNNKQIHHIDDNDLSLDNLYKAYPKCDVIITAILKRLDKYSEKVHSIVFKHNVYFLYRAYACLCAHTTPYQIYTTFKEKDKVDNIGAIHKTTFSELLTELTIKSLYQEQIDLLINDNIYHSKDNYCSYRDLINKMNEYNNNYHYPKRKIYQKAHLLFNPLTKQYRDYILNNNISYEQYFKSFARNIQQENNVIDFTTFTNMNIALKFHFDNPVECLYLYEILVYCNHKRLLTFKDYENAFLIQLITEDDFIKEGAIITNTNDNNKQNEITLKQQLSLNSNIQINMSNYKPYLNNIFQLGNAFKQQLPKFNINSPLELIEHYQGDLIKNCNYIPHNTFTSIMENININIDNNTAYSKCLIPFYDESHNINLIQFLKVLNILFPGAAPYTIYNYNHKDVDISFNKINYILHEKQYKDIKMVSIQIYSKVFIHNKTIKSLYDYFKLFTKYNNDKERITIKQLYVIVLNELNLYSEIYHNNKEAFIAFVSFIKVVDAHKCIDNNNVNEDSVNILTLSQVIESFNNKKQQKFNLNNNNNEDNIQTKIVIK